jgi:hypothetical protein
MQATNISSSRSIELGPVLFGSAAMFAPSIVDLTVGLRHSDDQMHDPAQLCQLPLSFLGHVQHPAGSIRRTVRRHWLADLRLWPALLHPWSRSRHYLEMGEQ